MLLNFHLCRRTMWLKRIACFVAFVMSMTGTLAFAQESILVPLEKENPSEKSAALNLGTMNDDIGRWLLLQSDLYRVVMTFNEQAKQLERVIYKNEEARNVNHEIQMTAKSEGRAPDESGNYGGEMPIIGSSLCQELDASLQRFIDKNKAALDEVVHSLVKYSSNLSDTEKDAVSTRMRTTIAAMSDRKRSQEILYLCLYKYKNESGVPTTWSVEKTLRQWYVIQLPLIDVWLGNVD